MPLGNFFKNIEAYRVLGRKGYPKNIYLFINIL
jgi:hypothetical protein